METILDSGHTWFLDSFNQGPHGTLVIRVVEGMSSHTKEMVEVAGREMGPFTRVGVTPESRHAEIRFKDVLGFFTHREDLDSVDPKMALEEKQSYVRQVQASSLRDYARAATGIPDVWWGQLMEFHVWTSDQIFQVFCTEPPEVVALELPANSSFKPKPLRGSA